MSGRRVDVSLYSIGDFDVAAIAARYGGGGHRNAAGFSVSLEAWAAEFA
jgi:nanoRNase/pAp phosphatase (c-di-AMP/oligoRNAs hydrolase)